MEPTVRIIDCASADNLTLNSVKRAIYICSNNNPDLNRTCKHLFTFGAAGVRKPKTGQENKSNLLKRLIEHEKKKREILLYRHRMSPWKRLWAADLTTWTPESTQLAEWLLYATVAKRFQLIATSVFKCEDPSGMKDLFSTLWEGLSRIEQIGNHQWIGDDLDRPATDLLSP